MVAVRSSLLGVLCVVLVLVCGVSSQGTDTNCSASFNWAGNDRQQDICLITAYLRSACLADPTDAFVDALPGPSYFYVQPTKPDDCTCSMVYYNTISACALCQNGSLAPWSGYITNCTSSQVTVAGYPENIPLGTSVPAWAYLDISFEDDFNVTAAKAYSQINSTMIVGTAPTTSLSASSSASSAKASSSSSTSLQPSALPAASPGSSKKSNTGAIAGGVVGGVVGACLIAAAIVYYLRRQRRPAVRNNMSEVEPTLVGSFSPPVSPGPMSTGPAAVGSVSKLYVSVVLAIVRKYSDAYSAAES
ncbi:uncharacterized protein PHACADRAFT_258000 [Phanerochaete carnosa HHB-10118-sp]|uniref:Uncharacterized protein n=1 Tax=Phanerochaete carnosa (strain HHB-10118-sp) TaxID=650164 RepID=K5UW40_PHACS|nr:uncharacterized protein PHACADRAFT_258000 [Phanerochaete carnosa HHB-10118-sp]EKM54266.1 hypothetical protein PHACADRAFT_258000 [Phanerochaete carnosa HHB-10118-sp]